MEAATGPRPMADARVGQQGTLTRLWARRGSRPRAVQLSVDREGRVIDSAVQGIAEPLRAA
jgi:hypothetical protein